MGKGKSSDVYILSVTAVNGRKITLTITPTSASSIELPSIPGVEGVVVGWIWEKIPFHIRYRSNKGGDIFGDFPKVSWNGIDISEWWEKKQEQVPCVAQESPFDVWQREPKELQAIWIQKDQEKKQKKQNEFMLNLSKDKSLPPLSEISVDDICSNSENNLKVENIRLLSSSGVSESEDAKRAYEDPITGVYEVILTSPKWIRAIDLFSGDSGTTCYDRPMGPLPPWSRELHIKGYVPVAFTLRVIVLLLSRLPRHAPNPIASLPLDVFYLVLAELWQLSHDEHEVPQWEIDWLAKREARLMGKVSTGSKGKKPNEESKEKASKRKNAIERRAEAEEGEEEQTPRRSPRVAAGKKK